MMICDLLRPVVLLFAEVCFLHLADMAKKELHGFTTMQLKT